MSETLTIYLGRDNREVFELQQDGVVVTALSVTRAVLRFGGYVLDTEDDEDVAMALTTSNQRVEIFAGKLSGLIEGVYHGTLTVFDTMSADNGFAWETFNVHVRDWPAELPEEVP